MARKNKDKEQSEETSVSQGANDQHSLAVNPHDPDFVNDGTSGATNPHE